MPQINYEPQDFDMAWGSRLQSSGVLRFSWARLLWSAITVGRSSWGKVIEHEMHSTFEMIYRGAMIYANLEESPTRKLAKSEAYESLDPTEKSATSYFLGLTMAKLFAERLLKVPWLMHVDVFRNDYQVEIDAKSRPDLFGKSHTNQWIVVEAKGRTNFADNRAKRKAKEQTQHLTSINGQIPALRVGILAFFNSGDKLEVYLKDPPTKDGGYELKINEDRLFFSYYRPFIDMIESTYGDPPKPITNNDRVYLTKYISQLDATIGLDQRIYELIKLRDCRALLDTRS